jgi:hypothetical protein
MSELLCSPGGEGTQAPESPPEGKFSTDVKGVYADGEVPHGQDKIPVFKVDKKEFMNNMTADRRRLRFPGESTAGRYMRQTKYNRPFFIEYEEAGKAFRRKVK